MHYPISVRSTRGPKIYKGQTVGTIAIFFALKIILRKGLLQNVKLFTQKAVFFLENFRFYNHELVRFRKAQCITQKFILLAITELMSITWLSIFIIK